MTLNWLSPETQNFSRKAISYFAIAFSCNSDVLHSIFLALPLQKSDSYSWARQVYLDLHQQFESKCLSKNWAYFKDKSIEALYILAFKFWKSNPNEYFWLTQREGGLRICFDRFHYKDIVFDGYPLKCYNVTDISSNFNRELINLSTIGHLTVELSEFLEIPFKLQISNDTLQINRSKCLEIVHRLPDMNRASICNGDRSAAQQPNSTVPNRMQSRCN